MEIKPAEIREAFAELAFGEAQSCRGLSVVPIVGGPEPVFDYCLAAAAHSRGLKVKDSGSVGQAIAENHGPKPVLIPVGTMLIGGLQNRTTNATVLVGAGEKVKIPASCVQQGRWSPWTRTERANPRFPWGPRREQQGEPDEPDGSDFVEAAQMVTPRVKAALLGSVRENRRQRRNYCSNQGLVWHAVSDELRETGARDGTSDLHAVYRQKRSFFDEAMEAFKPVENQRGAVFVYGGSAVGLEYVSRPDAWTHLHNGAIQSYLSLPLRKREEDAASHAKEVAADFVQRVANATYDVAEAPGLGIDCRLIASGIEGTVLVHAGEVVHAAYTADPNSGSKREPQCDRETFDVTGFPRVWPGRRR